MRKVIILLLILAVLILAALVVFVPTRKPTKPAPAPAPAATSTPVPVPANVARAIERMPQQMRKPVPATERMAPEAPPRMAKSTKEPMGERPNVLHTREEISEIAKARQNREDERNARYVGMSVEEWKKLSWEQQNDLIRNRRK